MAVIKRNGTKVDFNGEKIKAAIKKANAHSQSKSLTQKDIDDIAGYIEYRYHANNEEDITIEEIQDMVEDQIILHGASEVAKTYIRYRYSRMGSHDLEGIDKEANHRALSKLKIRKKNGTLEPYSADKILEAVGKSAARAREDGKLTEEESLTLITLIESDLAKKSGEKFVTTKNLHLLIEKYLEKVAPDVGKQYTNYHSFRMGQAESWEKIMGQCTTLIGHDTDNETMTQKNQNANADSTLSSTQKCFFADYTAEQYYERFFLTKQERQIASDGYLYWHDKNGRIIYTHNCFRRDTRFITEYGVRSFYDFSDGDEVYVLTHKGNWKKAIVKNYGYQPLQKVTFVKNSCKKEIYCTKDHRWLLKDGTETTKLDEGDVLISAPNISKIAWEDMTLTQKRMWCHGFALADGNLHNEGVKRLGGIQHTHVRLCGDKNKYASRFTECGYSCIYPKSYNGDAHIAIRDLHSKKIDLMKISKENVVYFINGYMSADGNKSSSGSKESEYRGIQVTGDNADILEDLLNMSGYYVTSKKDITGTETNYGKRNKHTVKYHTFESNKTSSSWSVKSIEKASAFARDTVWCLEVEDDHSFILEGGIPTGNCCLWRMDYVLAHGFQMNGIWYNSPKSLDVAFDVLGDLTLMAASQQYGGFTIPRIDSVLAPYAEMSFEKYKKKYMDAGISEEKADKMAEQDIVEEMESGFQGLEYKFNTVASSRGDYPFTTVTFGLDTSRFGKMASKICLKTRQTGQGLKGKKKPVLFPKLVFLYDKNLHEEGCVNHDVFEAGLECSSHTMYPDWLSLTGEGYVPSMYKKYGVDGVISPMGCRAFLSPYYERGGFEPADDDDKVVFEGRFNLGVISLNLPMMLAQAREEGRDFYEVLDYYLQVARENHKRTYNFIGHMKASKNPVGFCYGGFYGGNLNPEDEIAPALKAATMSFGITALNELQRLYNGHSLYEDNAFALEVMEHINAKIAQFKKEDHILYAIYGTPAENLCNKQVRQFRGKYGIVPGVSDREYVSNSFHCHVTEDITPIEKQDHEYAFWNLFNGGKIQYCRYSVGYNIDAIRTLVLRAMDMGFYEGVNLDLCFCDDCGYKAIEMGNKCPKCGGYHITQIDRMNGYLAFTRVGSDTRVEEDEDGNKVILIHSRYSPHKIKEISERVSM